MEKIKLSVKAKEKKEDVLKNVKVDCIQDEEGIVMVVIDESGKPISNGTIIRLQNNGVLVRPKDVDKNIGLPLNKIGQVQEKMLLHSKKK